MSFEENTNILVPNASKYTTVQNIIDFVTTCKVNTEQKQNYVS